MLWPISRYVKNPNNEGEWEWVEEFEGTEAEFANRIQTLQKDDPENQYRCWDCRES